jgi:hypothetical protein
MAPIDGCTAADASGRSMENPPMDNKEFTALNFALNRLLDMVERRDEALATFKKKAETDPINAVEWLDGTPQAIVEGNWAEGIRTRCDGKTAAQIKVVFANELKELDLRIDTWRPAHGSSPFHNAVENERLLAMREVRNALRMGLLEEKK